jgi:hypothetical protein
MQVPCTAASHVIQHPTKKYCISHVLLQDLQQAHPRVAALPAVVKQPWAQYTKAAAKDNSLPEVPPWWPENYEWTGKDWSTNMPRRCKEWLQGVAAQLVAARCKQLVGTPCIAFWWCVHGSNPMGTLAGGLMSGCRCLLPFILCDWLCLMTVNPAAPTL